MLYDVHTYDLKPRTVAELEEESCRSPAEEA